MGRGALTYQDSLGELHVDIEPMAGAGVTVTVYSGSIPDSAQRGRVEVMDNVARAFRYAGRSRGRLPVGVSARRVDCR